MNYAIDRNYVIQEIYGGMAQAKFTVLNSAFPDYARYVDVSRELEAKYAYNLDKAKEIITAEMEGMGATVVDGKFQFNGAPVSVMVLIRTEDERKQIGDYAAQQLGELGFTADPPVQDPFRSFPHLGARQPNRLLVQHLHRRLDHHRDPAAITAPTSASTIPRTITPFHYSRRILPQRNSIQ